MGVISNQIRGSTMKDSTKPKSKLLQELKAARKRVAELEQERSGRLRLERALSQYWHLLDALFRGSTELFGLKDHLGRYQAASSTFCTFAGKSEVDIRGRTDFEIFPQSLAEAFQRNDSRVLRTGKGQTWDETVQSRDTWSRYRITKTPVLTRQKACAGVLCRIEDITREYQVQEQYRIFHRLGEEGFWVLDIFGKILDVGRQYYDVTGYQYPDLLQKNLHDIEVLTTPDELLQQNQRIKNLGWDSFKTLHRGKDNRIIEFDVEVVFINIFGGRFFRFFREVSSEASRHTVNPVQINKAVAPQHRILLNLNDVIREAVELQCASMPRGMRIEQHLEPGIWLTEGNQTQILQVLMNLIGNSVEALDENGRIEIRTSNLKMNRELAQAFPAMKPGDYVYLTVEDNGCGIHENFSDKIFEPFTTTKPGGKGMGLFSANRNVQDHNGYITLRSQQGQGATFSVYLPATRVSAQDSQPEQISSPKGTETLLIIDEESGPIGDTQQMLENLAYHVMAAQDIQEAEEILQNYDGDIHVVILDAEIPEHLDYDILAYMRAMRPDMKVLLAGSNDLDESAQDFLDAGATSFVSKPFRLEVLAPKIRKMLGH
jgi:PAS domain S-box-containing protein